MKKPDFFIVGAPKCGTSSLRYYLEQHPEIFMSTPAEPLMFCPDIIKANVSSFEEYLTLFESAEDKVCGEKSTRYLFSEVAPQKIYELNPEAKIVIMLREPVSFMHSWHSELLMWFVEDIDDFEMALGAEAERKHGKKIPVTCSAPRQLSYREFAEYSIHVQRYLSIFNRDKIHFLILEDLKANPVQTFQELLSFLEVDSDFIPNMEVRNKNKKIGNMKLHRFFRTPPIWLKRMFNMLFPNKLMKEKILSTAIKTTERINVSRKPREKIDPELLERLKQEMAPEVNRLSKLIDKDLSIWA